MEGAVSDRLTDEQLHDVIARVENGRCHVCDGDSQPLPGVVCATCNGTGAFALNTETMRSILVELRERRAQFNVTDGATWSALNFAREIVKAEISAAILDSYRGRCERAVAVLERMLGVKP
jgi:hypothetical protein